MLRAARQEPFAGINCQFEFVRSLPRTCLWIDRNEPRRMARQCSAPPNTSVASSREQGLHPPLSSPHIQARRTQLRQLGKVFRMFSDFSHKTASHWGRCVVAETAFGHVENQCLLFAQANP